MKFINNLLSFFMYTYSSTAMYLQDSLYSQSFSLFSINRFSSRVLTTLCEQIEGVPLAGMIVIGDGQSARAVALSGSGMKLPVLWAKGGTANLYGMEREVSNQLLYSKYTIQLICGMPVIPPQIVSALGI